MPDNVRTDDVLEALARASTGLVYPSESDAPFEPFRWPATSASESARDAVVRHVKRGARIEEVSVDDFFAELQGSDDGERFKALRQAVELTLSGLKVIRAGERKIDVYLIGRTRAGDWAGLHTTSVET
jgi:hypothetical protein